MPEFTRTSLQGWNRPGSDEFRVYGHQSKTRKPPRSGKVRQLKALSSMEAGC